MVGESFIVYQALLDNKKFNISMADSRELLPQRAQEETQDQRTQAAPGAALEMPDGSGATNDLCTC